MTKKNKELLALGYLLNTLNTEEKLLFFQLLSKDNEFRLIFSNEKKLHEKLKSLENTIPENIKNKLYNNIVNKTAKTDKENIVTHYFKEHIIKMAIPSIFSNNKYIKEMCLNGFTY